VKFFAPATTILITTLIFLLWAHVSTADSGVLVSQSEATTSVLESAYGSSTSEGSSMVGAMPNGNRLTDILQSLSPLPVLGLGILGLFWVRRHTAEL
jgi:hypothetical protein